MTEIILSFPVRNRTSLVCKWIKTGNPVQPLICKWTVSQSSEADGSSKLQLEPTAHSRCA